MAFQVSPGVLVTEKDLTTVIPAVSVSIGGFAGFFKWGPVEEIALVSTEDQLVRRFGKPDDATATSFFTAANFLAYGIRLKLVRVVGDAARNAVASGSAVLVKNEADYESKKETAALAGRRIIAKHPGALGNALRVSICSGPDAFKKTLTETFVGLRGQNVLDADDDITTKIAVGSILRDPVTGQQRVVTAVGDGGDDKVTLDKPLDKDISTSALQIKWEFADLCGVAPGTSTHVASLGGSNDELHVVVVDTTGIFSGAAGTILERFVGLSKASDAKKEDNSSNYYVTVLNNTSQYVRFASHISGDWGEAGAGTDFADSGADSAPHNHTLTGGVDDNPTAADTLDDDRINGYDLFKDSDSVDVSFILAGEATVSVAQYIVNNICEVRKDCVAFISPTQESCVSNRNNEVEDIKTFRSALQLNTSYAFLDSGWKYQYDRYNDTFRWVPLNGDIAGLCARTDDTNDPWWSPAGYNRGVIKNVIKLSWSPSKFERDELYVNGINPVITTPGQGTVLFGDKTLLSKPSAFDRLNVRRLFIVLEKSIATAARFTLFEFNDGFTREQFKSLVEPFLRSVKARRGIYDYRVVCDESNNTPDVIDGNSFVGDIYIKPARSINTIQLNFIAVRTGVEFSEIVGKVG
jgi:phage tail sheath protein FI